RSVVRGRSLPFVTDHEIHCHVVLRWISVSILIWRWQEVLAPCIRTDVNLQRCVGVSRARYTTRRQRERRVWSLSDSGERFDSSSSDATQSSEWHVAISTCG